MLSLLLETVLQGTSGSRVAEVELQAEGWRVRVSWEGAAPTASGVARPMDEPIAPRSTSEAPATPGRAIVTATMHGTFYRAASPDQPPFAEVGDPVVAGQQLGLIEAMKMLHIVEAESAGRLIEVLVENGAAVEPGTALFAVEVLSDV